MKKSLFVKYFTIFSVIILSCMVFLGTVFSILITRYLRTERQQLLYENVSKATSFTSFNYELNSGMYIEKGVVRRFYSSTADTVNGVMFLTDLEGNTLICTEEGECVHTANKVPSSILLVISKKSEYREYGKLGKMYSSMHYTVGRAVVTSNGNVIGYLFASTPAGAISSLIRDIVKMFLIASFVAIIMSSIVIYVLTSIFSRPLKQMSIAAKSFGNGDFSTRISYSSKDEIGQFATSFNQMADSLSELETMRKNFIANVSHELKTPMTTIGGFIDGILDGTIPKDQQEHYLKIVSNEVKRLSRLVKSMLSVARIEAGEMRMDAKPFNISDTIFSTLFSFEKKIEEKSIFVRGLSEMEKIIVYGDEDLIHQVIYNLIDNAVKFCNEGGYLDFSVFKGNTMAEIHVKNSGNGLSKDELNHVFDRFYKTDKSRGLDKNGVGLGLYIVKTVLDMHKGRISVGSIKGEYTEFVFELHLFDEKKGNAPRLSKK